MNRASGVTVYVIFALEELPTVVDLHSAAVFLSREEPRWSIGAVSSDSFRLGRYDELPVTVTLQSGASVSHESRLTTAGLRLPSPVLRDIASSTARFKLDWNLACDEDADAETALLVVSCAQALGRLTRGVALVHGSQALEAGVEYPFDQAFAALFSGSPRPEAKMVGAGVPRSSPVAP